MATTLRNFASNIEEQLKQTGDDSITFNQIVLWCSYFINKRRYTKGGGIDSGAYLSIFSDLPVLKATETINGTVVKGRKYIELPESIYDYQSDGAIKFLSYTDFDETCMPSFGGVTFTRTTPAKAKRLYFSVYEKPSPKNPYFYVVKDKVYLLGIEDVNIPYLEIGIISVFNPFVQGGLDTQLDVGEEALADITAQVLNLGRFMMLMPSDIKNDSTESNNTESVPTTKLVSVNDQQQVQQSQLIE